MKIDRLLSIVIHLLNRDQASASELAKKFEVSKRTIQRDMETISRAGIPVASLPGAAGGYSILSTYKMDRQLMTAEDFYNIYTALTGLFGGMQFKQAGDTLEKIRAILPPAGDKLISQRREKLSIDLSALGGGPRQKEVLVRIEKAIDENRLIAFRYTSNKLERTERIVEPMTIIFKWRSWYLFGYCETRKDFRVFRVSRMRQVEILDLRFKRRAAAYQDYLPSPQMSAGAALTDFVFRFDPAVGALVEEFFQEDGCETDEEGRLIVRTSMPEDGWVYGFILSYGHFVEVLAPERVRNIIRDSAEKIASLYGDEKTTGKINGIHAEF